MSENAYILSVEEEAEIANKVFDGAAELDRMDPDWYKRINLNTLSMTDGMYCVLGQIYGGFWLGIRELRWSEEKADQMGVFIYSGDDDEDMAENEWIAKYSEMRECWVGQISDRIADNLLASLS